MKHPRAATRPPEGRRVGVEGPESRVERPVWPPRTVDELAGMIGIRSDLAETVAVCGPVVPSPYCFTPESRLRHLGEHLARALRMCAGLSACASEARHEALLAWEEERYGSRKGAKGAKGGA